MEKLVLKTPALINGKETKEIEYDLENLQGGDIQQATKELTKRNIQVLVPEVDQNYHAMLFAIAAGLSFEDMKALKSKDYMKACAVVRDFFLEG